MRYYAKQQVINRELKVFRALLAGDTSDYPMDVQVALDFLHDHLFDKSLNVSAMMEECNLRSHNVSSRFTHHLGLSPRDYIEDRRMMAAMRLLWHTEVEIYMVAFSVGYEHHESFTRAFKRWIGCAPSTFRERVASYRRRARPSASKKARPAKTAYAARTPRRASDRHPS